MRDTVLVTGGAGYIGSHVCKALARAGFTPLVADNLSTGHRAAVRWGELVEVDLRDRGVLDGALAAHRPVAAIHLAASAYVGESFVDPAKYWRNNVVAIVNLLDSLHAHGVARLVFSSSCATYGAPPEVPIGEATEQRPTNPYGRTKLVGERIIGDYAGAYAMDAAMLRYFNVCGADPDGEIGEDHDPETHLIPRALMAASGELEALEVFGDDYPTPDGTCIRDYVHVADLADAHVAALRRLRAGGGGFACNVGIGRGFSVREVIAAVERVTGRRVPVRIGARRGGDSDPPALVADGALCRDLLDFAPRFTDLDAMIGTAWRWHRRARG
jgi:UDP-glucose-4-epimerase GalE